MRSVVCSTSPKLQTPSPRINFRSITQGQFINGSSSNQKDLENLLLSLFEAKSILPSKGDYFQDGYFNKFNKLNPPQQAREENSPIRARFQFFSVIL